MKLTAKARAAVTALADIASAPAGEPVPLSDIAVRQRLSVTFLEQIFPKLRRAGLVESRRGTQGGYILAQAPNKTSAAQIVAAIDEEIRSTACVPGAEFGCHGTTAKCLTHGLWAELDARIDAFLSEVTLADIASEAVLEAAAFSPVEHAATLRDVIDTSVPVLPASGLSAPVLSDV